MLLRLLALAGAPVELAEAEVAVGDEGVYLERIRDAERASVAGLGGVEIRWIAAPCDLAREPERIRLVAMLLIVARHLERARGCLPSLLDLIGEQIRFAEPRHAERVAREEAQRVAPRHAFHAQRDPLGEVAAPSLGEAGGGGEPGEHEQHLERSAGLEPTPERYQRRGGVAAEELDGSERVAGRGEADRRPPLGVLHLLRGDRGRLVEVAETGQTPGQMAERAPPDPPGHASLGGHRRSQAGRHQLAVPAQQLYGPAILALVPVVDRQV